MAINIQVGGSPTAADSPENKEKEYQGTGTIKTKLQIRKSLDGNLLIYPHEDLDIVIDQKQGKIIAFSTDMKYDDKSYDGQNRFFKHLAKKGIVDPASIHGGNVYGALEAQILEPDSPAINKYDVALLVISRWIESEKPDYLYREKEKENREEELTNPENEDTTPLGKVPHAKYKDASGRKGREGTVSFGTGQSPYEEE
ncbi:MAG: hypothetical protein H7831_13750 [Magnetococcus sp. WYHC-3]